MSEAFTQNQVPIPELYQGKIKSIKIIPLKDSTKKFGVIFHNKKKLGVLATCTKPIDAQDTCLDISINALSANIYTKDAGSDTSHAQGGDINIYSKPWGWKNESLAGEYKNGSSGNFKLGLKPSSVTFSYKKTSFGLEHTEYQSVCKTLVNCQGSIQISGNNLVVLYSSSSFYETSGQDSSSTSYCQTFYSTINSLKEQEFLATGVTVGALRIIPLK
jgi:hypothetical protein